MRDSYKLYLDVQVINKLNRGEKVLISDYFKFDKKTCKYIGNSTHHRHGLDVIKKFGRSLTDSSIDSNYFTNNVNLLYRFPKLSLSRDKLSLYQEKTNFKISRDKEKSDICVVSNAFLESQLEQDWSIEIKDKNLILSFLQKGLEVQPDDHELINHINWINSISDDAVFLTRKSYGWRDDKAAGPIVNFLCNVHDKLISGRSTYVYYFSDPETYNWLNNNKHKLIMDTELNKLCTEDSHILKQEDWESINSLLQSSDVDNVSVGMTLMANCNIEESGTVLALLFAFQSDKMKQSKVWTQVNFKGLKKQFREFLDIHPSNWGYAYNSIIEKLSKQKLLTLWASRYVAEKLFKNVLVANFGVGTEHCVFTIDVDSLQLIDKYEETLVETQEEAFAKADLEEVL
tara:strand:+ start:4864 stop:6066 length:1203 start_codon:yes stop_codon:yes gene_type:complete